MLLSVYDSDGSLIVKACGRTPPVPITSSSNSLRIVFKSDSSRNATGFKAAWFTDTVINNITSPNYPLPYPNNVDKVKLIEMIHLILIVCICIDMATYCWWGTEDKYHIPTFWYPVLWEFMLLWQGGDRGCEILWRDINTILHHHKHKWCKSEIPFWW